MKKIFSTIMLMSGVMLISGNADAQTSRTYNTTTAGTTQVAVPQETSPEEAAANSFFEQLDINKDGMVSRDEIMAFEKKRIDENFDSRDLNKDGYISYDEVVTYEKNRAEQHKAAMEKRRAELDAEYRALQKATAPNPNDYINPDPAGLGDLNNNNGPLGEAVPASVTGDPGM